MVGFALIMGGDATPSRAVVKSRCAGFRMKAQFMKHEFRQSSACSLLAPLFRGPEISAAHCSCSASNPTEGRYHNRIGVARSYALSA